MSEVVEKIETPTAEIATEKQEETKISSISKLEKDIINQIEYYFGDANLLRDKFLQEQIGKDEGWVALDVLLTFKRLASLSSDSAVIVEAVGKSDNALVEISEDKTKIRRHPERPIPELNEATRKEVNSRTAYVKGFPPVGTEMSNLIEFFEPYEKITNIIMRKYLDKPTKKYLFKGSVFVTFANKEQCNDFITKEKISYNDVELVRKWQDDYIEEKRSEHKKKNKKQDAVEEITLPRNAVIYFTGFAASVSRESIKEAISAVDAEAEIAFIDYNKGDPTGHVRLTTENSAKPLFDKFQDGKLKVEDAEATAKVLEGDEETLFLRKVMQDIKNRKQNNNRFKKGGGHYDGRRNNSRKRRGERDDDEPREKKVTAN